MFAPNVMPVTELSAVAIGLRCIAARVVPGFGKARVAKLLLGISTELYALPPVKKSRSCVDAKVIVVFEPFQPSPPFWVSSGEKSWSVD